MLRAARARPMGGLPKWSDRGDEMPEPNGLVRSAGASAGPGRARRAAPPDRPSRAPQRGAGSRSRPPGCRALARARHGAACSVAERPAPRVRHRRRLPRRRRSSRRSRPRRRALARPRAWRSAADGGCEAARQGPRRAVAMHRRRLPSGHSATLGREPGGPPGGWSGRREAGESGRAQALVGGSRKGGEPTRDDPFDRVSRTAVPWGSRSTDTVAGAAVGRECEC